MKKNVLISIILGTFVGATSIYRYNYRMPLKEYTSYALYMAHLDDQIARLELGELIEFDNKKVTLQYRYHLFLQLNKRKSTRELEMQIKYMEHRLKNAINKYNKGLFEKLR